MTNWINRLLEKKKAGKRTDASPEQRENAAAPFHAGDVVTQMLQNMQVTWETRQLPNNSTDYHFVYQRGDFRLLTRHNQHSVYVHYLFFMDASMIQIDHVRSVCNLFNQRFTELKVLYSINESKYKVDLHLSAAFRLTTWSKELEDDFARQLTLFFEGAREFRTMFKEQVGSDTKDPESTAAAEERERYLAFETELENEDALWRSHDTEHIVIGDLLRLATGSDDHELASLTVVTDNVTEQELDAERGFRLIKWPETEEMRTFDVTSFMVDDTGSAPKFRSHSSTLVLATLRGTLTVVLEAKEELNDTLYFNVTMTFGGDLPSPTNSHDAQQADEYRRCNFAMSYSRKSEAEKHAEFEYLWQEAQDRRERGLDLSDEQEFVQLGHKADVAYNLYWGQHLYLNHSFLQALSHLENAYHLLYRDFHKMPKDERRRFFDLCYYIGMCYLRLQRPKQAYYYLDSLFNLNDIRYTQAYINCLVKGHDYRALGVINAVLANVQRIYDDEPEAPEEGRRRLKEFILFLRRSKARTLIDTERLDEAEKTLHELLADDNDHESHLLEMLALVAQMRAAAAAIAADKSTLSVTTEFPKTEKQ